MLQAMIRLTNNKPCSVVANPHVNLAFTTHYFLEGSNFIIYFDL